jgi:hypothetical protein
MSDIGPKRTSSSAMHMSAFGRKADGRKAASLSGLLVIRLNL